MAAPEAVGSWVSRLASPRLGFSVRNREDDSPGLVAGPKDCESAP